MKTVKRSRRSRGLMAGGALLLVIALSGCLTNESTAPNPAVASFVGDWSAVSLVLTEAADTTVSPDLIALGATFTINVQPSGEYTAILLYSGQAQTEIGRIEVSGQSVTLARAYPSKSITEGTYSFNGDHLTIDGQTEFDFNLDGTPEPALVHFDLVKQ